jgi:hypothetical protein
MDLTGVRAELRVLDRVDRSVSSILGRHRGKVCSPADTPSGPFGTAALAH